MFLISIVRVRVCVAVLCCVVPKNMPWYAVARGRNLGVYKTWVECEKNVKHFPNPKYRKFSTEEEAINFVNEHGQNNMEEETSTNIDTNLRLEKEQSPPFQSPSKRVTGSPSVSSPKLKANALKQRLTLLEKMFEDSMLELRIEIDTIKDRMENIDLILINNSIGESEKSEKIKSLQESLSNLATSYRNSVQEVKKEIDDLKLCLKNLESEIGESKVNSEELSMGGSILSTFKRNLFKEAVIPVATKRLYSSTAGETSRATAGETSGAKKRKTSITTEPTLNTNTDNSFLGFDVDEQDYVHVYTDGACEKNGRVGARAGVGVWFGDNHPLNYSEPVQGRPTNNTAEIQAATCAIDLARKAGINKLVINTDSEFLINCITIWIHKWKKKGWKVTDGGPVKNKEDLIALEQAMEGMNIKWNHVRGHKGNHGNEMADELAKKGAKKRR